MANAGNFLAPIEARVVAIASIITALGVIIGGASTVIALQVGGSPALAVALTEERKAQDHVRIAREELALDILEAVCAQERDPCLSPAIKNTLEATIQHGIAVGTRLTREEQTKDVRGPADLPEPSLPNLENLLTGPIVACIIGSLGVEASIVNDALQGSKYFGSPHGYAGLVWTLITREVTRKSLEASPDFVEKPKWWRDPLLAVGVAVGGLMVGGAAVWFVAKVRQQAPQQGGGGPQNP